jgi:hypothetical protein
MVSPAGRCGCDSPARPGIVEGVSRCVTHLPQPAGEIGCRPSAAPNGPAHTASLGRIPVEQIFPKRHEPAISGPPWGPWTVIGGPTTGAAERRHLDF